VTRLAILAALLASLTTAAVRAADAPAEIKLGTLYASSGRFASISMPVHDGLKLWIDQKNADGGVYVKAFNKKIPLKLIAYDDQSNTATAATLYNQLITQDKVDILIADSGSVLTSVAVPIARDHKMLLIDQTGTGANFFTPDNPYIALMADPVSSVWPKPLADFLTHDGPGLGIKRVAMLYATNDFTGTQANTVRKLIKESNSGVEIVFDEGIPTETSNYTVLLNNIRASNPDAVLHLGYASNDIAFLRNVQDSGIKFKFLFCIYPGVETELSEKNLGSKALDYVFTYVTSSDMAYKNEFGMSLKEYKDAWQKKYADSKVEFGFNSIAGYTTGSYSKKRCRSRPVSINSSCARRSSACRATSRHWTAHSSSMPMAGRSASSRRSGNSSPAKATI
jgi:branched-chain amino acid transport system substrate-binding protein